VKNGVDRAAEDMRVTVEYQAPQTFDMVAMSQLIDAAVASEPDGLVVSIPDADALGDSIRAAVDAGIPVISMNSGSDVANELGILVHVGQTEYEAGFGGGDSLESPITLFPPYFAPDEEGAANTGSNSFLAGPGTNPLLYALQSLTPQQIANGNGPDYNCPRRPIQALTDTRQTITDAITAMQPRGSTVIPEGLAWAWRVISPGLPYDQGAPYSDKSVAKVVILLSDGRNQVERGSPYFSQYSAYGFAKNGHLGPADGSQTRQVLNAKTAELCNNIKADHDGDPSTYDIYVYTIALEINTGNAAIDTETKAMLEACATPPARCPGQQCFYDTPSGSDLDQVFSKIAIGLAGLRVAK
jgi:hypothetical protein